MKDANKEARSVFIFVYDHIRPKKFVIVHEPKREKSGVNGYGDVGGWKEGRNFSGVGDQSA